MKNKPTKEYKHEELLGVDYTDDYSVKVFGYRDKKGVIHITREEISNPKIDSILKEADKEFDESLPVNIIRDIYHQKLKNHFLKNGKNIRQT